MKLKKGLFLLIIVLSIFTFNQNIIFADSTDDIISFEIKGYTFTYENAPLKIREEYKKSCEEISSTPLPDDEIFISEENITNYTVRSSIGTYTSYKIRYSENKFIVSGAKNYTVYNYEKVGYNYTKKGNPVHLVQLLLNRVGYNLNVDSSFGSKTYNAVKSFESKNLLTVDGIVGNKTWICFSNKL